MDGILEQDSPQILDQAQDALDTSHKALSSIQESAKLVAEADKIRFESLSEVANYFRAERQALQAMVKEVEGIALELMELQSSMNDLRNSLIEEYEIQQQITAAMQTEKSSVQETRFQQEESVQKPSFGNFFKES